MSRAYLVGLDMGGTNVRCGAITPSGKVLIVRRGPAYARRDAETILRNIANNVRAIQDEARRAGLGMPRGIGVAVPGPLDLRTGTVLAAPHVKAWRAFPLRERLERELGSPVTVENDANAWALGEFWRGAARGYRDVVLLTLGTGVGGAIIVGGRIVHGAMGMAGELGHVTVEPDGLRCDCGAHGCLEAYASASGLLQLVRARLRPGQPMPRAFIDEQGRFTVKRLAEAARAGNRLARTALVIAGHYLGIAVASFINIFNPELLVIGGGVAGAMPLMRQSMMREVRARAFRAALRQARIARAALGEDAGVVGAAYAAIEASKKLAPGGNSTGKFASARH
jgi:glucokinase